MLKVFFSSTESGFIDFALFKKILIEFYIPLWREKYPKGPLLLIADFPDVHHFDAELVTFFLEHGVMFTSLPHNSSTLLQMLDLILFGILKKEFYKLISKLQAAAADCSRCYLAFSEAVGDIILLEHTEEEWAKLSERNKERRFRCFGLDGKLSKRTVTFVTEFVFKHKISVDNIKRSFEVSGVVPYCPDVVYTKIASKNVMTAISDANKDRRKSLRHEKSEFMSDVRAELLDSSLDLDLQLLRLVELGEMAAKLISGTAPIAGCCMAMHIYLYHR